MKNKFRTLVAIVTAITFLPCQAQKSSTVPKIENYTKGELEIKVAPFGDGYEINVGKVLPDGTIQFSWPDIDLADYESSGFVMNPLKSSLGMNFCHDKKIKENNTEIKAVDTKHLYLYKYGQNVGALLPTTQKELNDLDNDLIVGGTTSWFYSDADGKFKAECTVYEEKGGPEDVYEIDKNNVRNTTTYNIDFKKGWNLVETSLLELKIKYVVSKGVLSSKLETIASYKGWVSDIVADAA